MPVKLQTTHQQSHWLFYVPESGSCWSVCSRRMSVFSSPFHFSLASPSASATYYVNQPEDISTQFSSNCCIFSCLAVQFSSVAQSCPTLRPHGLQHTRPPCPSPTPVVYSNSCSSSQWCHPTISSSVVPISSCPQSVPVSGSCQMSQFFEWGGQSIGVSASTSVLPMNTQDWSPLGWTGWISLKSKGLSRVFSNTIVQKHQFFNTQFSHIHTRLLEKPIVYSL